MFSRQTTLLQGAVKQAVSVSSPPPLASPAFTTTTTGAEGTTEWAMQFLEDGEHISPWHDIPLHASSSSPSSPLVFNFVNEIPLGTRAKMEVATKQEMNPIKQDLKKGKLRFYTYGDTPFNYGCLPRTWEDPNVAVEACGGCVGDNDPLDVVDLSGAVIPMGAVMPSRAIGVVALIDEGETDWKLLTVPDTEHFASLHTLAQARQDPVFNKRLAEVLHWFRYYKTADGKPENKFGFNGDIQDERYDVSLKMDDVEGERAYFKNQNQKKTKELFRMRFFFSQALALKCQFNVFSPFSHNKQHSYALKVVEETMLQYGDLMAGRVGDHSLALTSRA